MFWNIVSTLSIVSSILASNPAPQPRTDEARGANTAAANVDAAGRQHGDGRGNLSGSKSITNAGPASNAGGPVTAHAGTIIAIRPAAAGARLYGFDTSVGSAAPPDTLGGCPMTPFGLDLQPTMVDVTSVASPCPSGGSLAFNYAMGHRRIGDGWATWSHGYTGDVYYSNLHQDVVVTLPPVPAPYAFYFYLEPDPFTPAHTFTITADDGSSATFSALGSAGAAYCGIYVTYADTPIQSFMIHDNESVGYAIGEFGIACFCEPVSRACCWENVQPAHCEEGIDILECAETGGRWDIDATLCSDLMPPCGYGACCYGEIADPGYEPWQCIGDYTFHDCMYLSEYTSWTGGESCADPEFTCPMVYPPCFPSGGCDEFIARVQLNDIDNSSACDGYADYTDLGTTVVIGVDYPITVTNGTPYSGDVCSIWVDWNHDRVFTDEPPELIGDLVGGGVSPPYSMILCAPAGARPGDTVIRIRIDYDNPDPDPCHTTTYGEVEDYTLHVVVTGEGACCNTLDGSCLDEYEPAACVALGSEWRWYYQQECALLEPPCGDPGCCCDSPEVGTGTPPYLDFRANCDGRFLSGVTGEDCVPQAFTPMCGSLPPPALLYAPTQPDNAAFRAAVSALLMGAAVDYFDARYGTPTVAAMSGYAAVMTWVNYSYQDRDAMGNVLADYNDLGGRVLLGQWCLPTAGNYLGGRIMTAAYCPATATSWTSGTYVDGSGTMLPLTGPLGGVHSLSTDYCDVIAVREGAIGDGDMSGHAAVAFWPDYRVICSPGNSGLDYTTGDVALLIANMVVCNPVPGACCNLHTAECIDDVDYADCAWRWYSSACATLVPPCADPGACCDAHTGACTDEVLAAVCRFIGRVPTSSTLCGELPIICGDPGCCCDYPEPGQVTEPFFEFRANCDGRFIPGAFTLCGDLDESGVVDMTDYNLFLDAFGTCRGQPSFDAAADLDGDGCVSLVDFQIWRNCYQFQGTDCTAAAFDPPCGLQEIWCEPPEMTFPPPTVCDQAMTQFPLDPRPLGVDVSSVPTPCPIPGVIEFYPDLNHRRSGGWPPEHDLYYSNGSYLVTLTMRPVVTAVYFYVEPNSSAMETFQAWINGAVLCDEFETSGSAGVRIGVCGSPGSPIETIQLTCTSGNDFAIGQFGIACADALGACCDEETGNCSDDVYGSACTAAHARFVAAGFCDELDPECGNPGACCDDATAVCVDDVLELLCPPSWRFAAATPCAPWCVELPPWCWDGVINAPGTWSGTTAGAGDDCGLRAGQDVTVRVIIPASGNWQFNLCASTPIWDTYMFLGEDCCASSWYDDDGCATVLSRIQVPGLAAGTYYVDIEPYSSSGSGAVVLDVYNYEPEARSERAIRHIVPASRLGK